MTIPEHVNFTTFYWAAKAKGVKIQSRFKGVTATAVDKRYLWWKACCKKKHLGYFPFTAKGEKQAHEAYEKARIEHESVPDPTSTIPLIPYPNEAA